MAKVIDAEIKGLVKKILTSKGSWGIVLCETPSKTEFKIKGSILPLQIQSECTFKGSWEEQKPEFGGGQIFNAMEVDIEKSTTTTALQKKLEELEWIGKKRAAAIMELLLNGKDPAKVDPDQILDTLLQNPKMICSIPGITETRAEDIYQGLSVWKQNQEVFRAEVQLLKHLPGWIKNKAFRQWPVVLDPNTKLKNPRIKSAIEILADNPYRLMEIPNVGFKRADKYALDSGIPKDDPRRKKAALFHLLDTASQSEGHTYISLDEIKQWSLVEKIDGIYEIEPIIKLAQRDGLVFATANMDQIATMEMWQNEQTIKEQAMLLSQPSKPTWVKSENETKELIEKIIENNHLTEEQAEAVRLVCTCNFLIVTGGPGVGKTYTIQAIIQALEAISKVNHPEAISLCAPTGKAARRMQQMTKHPAKTVHQTLGFSFEKNGFSFGHNNYIPTHAVICDESSMLDVPLATQLFAAINENTKFVLVGDVDQLPSVGPGNVLADLIHSGKVPVVRLTKIMRQAEDSAIIVNSHRIIQGEKPLIDNEKYKDFKLMEVEQNTEKSQEREETLAEFLFWYKEIRSMFPKLGVKDIQLLSPQKNGDLGTIRINEEIRRIVNPENPKKNEIVLSWGKQVDEHGNVIPESKRSFREGDRVINTSNNYDLGVMNGEMGVIARIDFVDDLARSTKDKKYMLIEFDDGRTVNFTEANASTLMLGYCITIHKSQGSEWPVVMMPISGSHAFMLTRRLLYTAITRSKKMIVMVGTEKAVKMATKNVKDQQRKTFLLEMLSPDTKKLSQETIKQNEEWQQQALLPDPNKQEQQKITNNPIPPDVMMDDIPF